MRRTHADPRDRYRIEPHGFLARIRAQTPAEYAQTAAYAAALQNKDGGFAATAGQLSSLGATNSGLRVLKHVGGSVPDILGCIKYVKSCRDARAAGSRRCRAASPTWSPRPSA